MPAPYKSKKAAYQHNCGDCPDPEGPNFVDLQHMQQFEKQTLFYYCFYYCFVFSVGMFVLGLYMIFLVCTG